MTISSHRNKEAFFLNKLLFNFVPSILVVDFGFFFQDFERLFDFFEDINRLLFKFRHILN